MSAIGILGGMGPQASAHLLRLLVRDTPNHTSVTSDSDFPEIIVLSVPVPNFISNKRNLDQAKEILIGKTKQLEQAGCTVNGIACNTAHLLLPALRSATSVPFVSIPELVAKSVRQRGDKRIGLLATPTTLASTLFDAELGPDQSLVRPSATVANQIEELILKQLKGTITTTDRRRLHQLVDEFILSERLDSVILGCTELPLIFGELEDKPVIDTLQVLSDALLTRFFAGRKKGALT